MYEMYDLYRIIGISYAVMIVFLLALPFYRIKRAKRFARFCKGKVIESKYGFSQMCETLLAVFYKAKRESVIVLFLDDKNLCIDVKVRVGSKKAIKFITEEIYSQTLLLIKTTKVIVIYNHYKEEMLIAIDTKVDVRQAATLYTNLPDGVKLAGYVVRYKRKTISLIESQEFKKMISGNVS